MGRAVELLTGYVTAPDTTQTALTMAAGNSLTVRNAREGSKVMLLQAWADSQTAGILRIRSPQLHDNVQGLRLRAIASEVDPLLPRGFFQQLMPQDTLTVDLSGSATAADIESACMLVYYEDLPGIDGRFIDRAELVGRIVDLATLENTLALGVGGGYSGEEALNAEFDLLHANTDYAILGFAVTAECAAIRYRGSDFGNLGVGGPGNDLDKEMTGEWFVHLSDWVGVPLIPVFNSANIGSVLLDGVQDENGTDVTVTTILAQLS
jgi:hypothetical protein